MIVLNLCCDQEHLFEGWFASASAFEAQCVRSQVACPVCGSTAITRRPTAPYVNIGAPARTPNETPKGTPPPERPDAPAPPPSPEVLAVVMAMLRKAGKASEDVGERFPEEVRRIHYGESESRSIKGQASRDDLSELFDEGIILFSSVEPSKTVANLMLARVSGQIGRSPKG